MAPSRERSAENRSAMVAGQIVRACRIVGSLALAAGVLLAMGSTAAGVGEGAAVSKQAPSPVGQELPPCTRPDVLSFVWTVGDPLYWTLRDEPGTEIVALTTTLDWGDGTVSTFNGPVSPEHPYAATGIYVNTFADVGLSGPPGGP